MKNEFLKELQWRGLINDCTDLEALCINGRRKY